MSLLRTYLGIGVLLTAAIVTETLSRAVFAEGYGTFPAYSGPNLPASAGVFTDLPIQFGGPTPNKVGYFLDVDGDGHADLADLAEFNFRFAGHRGVFTTYVSPSDSRAGYSFVNNTGSRGLERIRRLGDKWEPLDAFGSLPWPLTGLFDFSPDIRVNGDGLWTGPVTFRRLRGGGDAILGVSSFLVHASTPPFSSDYAVCLDGPDADEIADHWTTINRIPGCEVMTIDDRGNALARRVAASTGYHATEVFRVYDANGDGLPETIDESSVILTEPFTSGLYGPSDYDLGSDRALLVGSMVAVNLDSAHRPIAGSLRPVDGTAPGLIPYFAREIVVGHDGAPLAYALDQNATEFVLARWNDPNFDGITDNRPGANPLEVTPILRQFELPRLPDMGEGVINNVSLAGLDVLDTSSGGASVRFRDFGEFPGGEAFTFRFGSTAYSSMWVGRNGIVSFAGPLGGVATLDALHRVPGAIAAGWSDEWDTSDLEVFAGYAPVTKSFVTGARVLAFVVEWHNLRSPAWSSDPASPMALRRGCSMRLLLFSDGSYRTDFGAMEAAELGPMRLVTGFSGPGLADTALAVDASAHTFGDAPAGTRAERVAGEAFDAASPPDIGHLWVRWLGYPERSDPPGPAPVVINPQLKARKKLAVAAEGSNIALGARLIVDDTAAFELRRAATGRKWVVPPSAASVPSGRTVRQLFGDGHAHTLVVVNPDGQASAPASLP